MPLSANKIPIIEFPSKFAYIFLEVFIVCRGLAEVIHYAVLHYVSEVLSCNHAIDIKYINAIQVFLNSIYFLVLTDVVKSPV